MDPHATKQTSLVNEFDSQFHRSSTDSTSNSSMSLLSGQAKTVNINQVTQIGHAAIGNQIVSNQQVAVMNQYSVPPVPLIKEESTNWGLPNQHPDFTGREEELRKIQASLNQNQAGVISQSIVGLGGIGKTTIAAEYAHRALNENHYDFVVWIQAYSQTTLRNEFQQLATAFGLSIEQQKEMGIKSIITFVYQKLSAYKKVLLIFDNAKDMSVIQDKENTDPTKQANFQLPQSHQRGNQHKLDWLITTRNQLFSTRIPSIKLNEFTEKEARDYIQKRLPSVSIEEADQLAKLLYYFPLALAQAVSYIMENSELFDYTIKDYRELYNKTYEDQRQLLDEKMPDDRYQQTVYTTWTISVRELQKASPLSVDILNMIAYFAPDAIPIDLIKGGIKDQSEAAVNKALKHLSEYSLIQTSKSMVEGTEQIRCIGIHRLVQTVIRLHHEADEEDKQKREEREEERIITNQSTILKQLEKGALALSTIYPFEKKNMSDYSYVRLLLPHGKALLNQLEKQETKKKEGQKAAIEIQFKIKLYKAYLMALIADIYNSTGDYHQEKELLKKTLEININILGQNHIGTARTLTNLGNAYGNLGKVKKKIPLLEQALIIFEGKSDNTNIAKTLTSLGEAHADIGNALKHKEFAKRALDIDEELYGPNHPETAQSLASLAEACGSLGDFKQKKALLKRAFIIKENYYDVDNPSLATILTALGNVYKHFGKIKKARGLQERALKINEKFYGPNHVQTASALINLGNTYGDLGETEKQKELCKQSLKIFESYYGKEHVDVSRTLVSLGAAYFNLRDFEHAKKLFERASEIDKKTLGMDHPETAVTMEHLGNAYGALGNIQKQQELFEYALKIKESHYGSDHVEVAKTKFNLGYVYKDLNKVEKAREKVKEVKELKGIKQLANQQLTTGKKHFKSDQFEKAKELFQMSLKTYQQDFPSASEMISLLLYNIGSCYRRLGDLQQASKNYKESLSIREKFYGDNHEKTQKVKDQYEEYQAKCVREVKSSLSTISEFSLESQFDQERTQSKKSHTNQEQTAKFFKETRKNNVQDLNEANDDEKAILKEQSKCFKK